MYREIDLLDLDDLENENEQTNCEIPNKIDSNKISSDLLSFLFHKYVQIYKKSLMSANPQLRREIRTEYYNDFDVCLREYYSRSHSNLSDLNRDDNDGDDEGERVSFKGRKRKTDKVKVKSQSHLPQQQSRPQQQQQQQQSHQQHHHGKNYQDYRRRLSWNEIPKRRESHHLFKIYTFEDEVPQVAAFYSKAKEDCDNEVKKKDNVTTRLPQQPQPPTLSKVSSSVLHQQQSKSTKPLQPIPPTPALDLLSDTRPTPR